MTDVPLDSQERVELCDLLDELGPRLSGPPGELLLYIFGRQGAAQFELSGPPEAVAAVNGTHFGM